MLNIKIVCHCDLKIIPSIKNELHGTYLKAQAKNTDNLVTLDVKYKNSVSL
jgi:hypothetical protein